MSILIIVLNQRLQRIMVVIILELLVSIFVVCLIKVVTIKKIEITDKEMAGRIPE
jgi:hypothetical protein